MATSLNDKSLTNLATSGNDRDLVSRAEALIPILRERMFVGDRDRRLPDATINDLIETGLIQMMAPRARGGSEAGLAAFFDAAVALGAGDGATAWLFGILGCHHWVLAHFEPAAQDELYGSEPYAFFPLTFSGKGGSARKVEGGYRVTGEWSFATGIDFSDWVGCLAKIEGEESQAVNLLIPKDEVEVVDDWFVSGMRGTGSRSFRVQDVFVPDHMTLLQSELMTGRTPGASAYPDYKSMRASLHSVLMVATVGAVAGLARHAIEAFVDLTKGRTGYGGIDHAARSSTQFAIADSMARWDAVHHLMRGHFVEIDAWAQEGRTAGAEQRLRYRRDATLLASVCAGIVETICTGAGARAQKETSPFQLIQRDINTVRTHVLLDRHEANELYGKYVLGLDLGAVRQ